MELAALSGGSADELILRPRARLLAENFRP
jgi:hypothetical protein